jgi:hypothetical protein
MGVLSYTYSRLYGNYTGLTSTDLSDGVGRNGANTDRAFDEPFMQFDAHGKLINGPLPTDRPHTLKINAYYTPKYKWFHPTLGIFQQIYSGTPVSSYESVQNAPVFVEGRGKYVPLSLDQSNNWVTGAPVDMRTPRYTQTDLSVFHDFNVSKTNENLKARIGADCLNCFNQHSVTQINSNMIATGFISPYNCGAAGVTCSTVTDEAAGFNYASLMKGYDYMSYSNSQNRILNNLYGKAQGWQSPRYLRFQVKFTF